MIRNRAAQIGTCIREAMLYVGRLRERMDRRGWDPNDRLYQQSMKAYDALRGLRMGLHYASCGMTGGNRTAGGKCISWRGKSRLAASDGSVDEVMFPVSIVRYTSDHQPGWVVCEFRDIHGRLYVSGEVKQVYVSDAYLDEATAYPVPGQTECVVIRTDGPVSTVRFTGLTWDGVDDDDHPFEVPTALLPAGSRPAVPSAEPDGGAA